MVEKKLTLLEVRQGEAVEQLRAQVEQLKADLERAIQDRRRLVAAVFRNVDRETYGVIMRAENPAETCPRHVCGLTGYNGMIDPPCEGCQKP